MVMSIWRRVAYAGLGMLPVSVALFALFANYGATSRYFGGRAFLHEVFRFDHEWTVLAFCMLAVGLYLLTSAIRGERLFSRKWPVSAVAAVILAWVLISGVALLRGFIAPEEPRMPWVNNSLW